MEVNCPSCGGAVSPRLEFAKLVVCEHCQVSLFLEDEVVRNVGERSALAEVPSILELGRRYRYRNWTFDTYGRIRFDYGDGFWDEWWVMLDTGHGQWISIDEGDIAVESPLPEEAAPPAFDSLAIGADITVAGQALRVTELNEAVCIGLEGELPEVISPGERHRYAHLSGPNGLLITLEYFEDTHALFKGLWVDPFEIEAL